MKHANSLVAALLELILSRQKKYRNASIALMAAIALPVIICASGFTVDVGLWFAQDTALQTGTDAAAFKAARDLAVNAATTPATLQADAVAEANRATQQQFGLSGATLSETQLADPRQVKVSATVPAKKYFSQIFFPGVVNISASSTAGVAYSTISSEATCYSIDSYTYLYSTGLGTIDTSHSSGIDPFQCGSPPSPPAAYNAYCGGGVLGCSLNLANLGATLLPFAIQIGPNGGAGGLAPVLAVVEQTLANLLSAGGTASGPTVLKQGSPQCPGNVCTIPAGTYNGGLIIGSGLTLNFVASGSNTTFLIENGSLIISTADTLGSADNTAATFFFGGANPGAFIFNTQVQVNTAPINTGSIVLNSTATFKSSSLAGTETSSPIAAMPYAQSAAMGDGLLSILGLPGANLIGTNFESVVATCAQATATCQNPVTQPAQFESNIVPSALALAPVTALVPGLTASSLLNETETSTTVNNADVSVANGVATDWSQQETAQSVLTNTLTAANVESSLGISPNSLLGGLLAAALNPVLAQLTPQSYPAQTASATGVFVGQTSQGTPTGACGAGVPVLYSSGTSLQPGFSASYTDILNSAGAQGSGGAVTMSDSVTICGNSEIAAITPISPGKTIVASTAGGASALELLQ